MQCPCGSQFSFKQCCSLVIEKKLEAKSPEQLMRSRYSAYATNAADYIYHTYAQPSRALQSIVDIDEWANATTWLKLIVHSASDFSSNHCTIDESSTDFSADINSLPNVCFSAFYQHQGSYFLMKETSRFVKENNQWRYLDGEVSINEALDTPKRNEPCFCNSKKKFKKCCGA